MKAIWWVCNSTLSECGDDKGSSTTPMKTEPANTHKEGNNHDHIYLSLGRDAVGRNLPIIELGLCPGNLCSITLVDHILVCQLSVSHL